MQAPSTRNMALGPRCLVFGSPPWEHSALSALWASATAGEDGRLSSV